MRIVLIMFWKLNPAAAQSPTPPAPVVFSAEHPNLEGMDNIDANSLISEKSTPQLEKLSRWFKLHEGTAGYCTFYISSQNVDIQFRKFALKSQIITGVEIIMKQEEICKELSTIPKPTMLQFPASPHIANLIEVKNAWHNIKVYDLQTQILKSELNKIKKNIFTKQKVIVANLVSLLSTVDTIPSNYIPLIKFQEINISTEQLLQNDAMAMAINKKIINIQNLSRKQFDTIDFYDNLFCDSDPDQNEKNQKTFLRDTIHQFLPFFNDSDGTVPISSDPRVFFDIVMHPCSLVADVSKEFSERRDVESYWHLAHAIVDRFEIELCDVRLVGALCSAAIAPLCFPETRIDGIGQDNPGRLSAALTAVTVGDPALILAAFADLGGADGENVRAAAIGLQGLTSEWRAVMRFAVEFTNSELLGPKLQATREAAMAVIQD